TRAWPAGVSVPATLASYFAMSLFRPETPKLRSNEPRLVPGRGSPTVPSPFRSDVKISDAEPFAERGTFDRRFERKVVVVASLKCGGRYIIKERARWCRRSSPAGP